MSKRVTSRSISVNKPLLSLITPTFDREHFLCALYEVIRAQEYEQWEWLIGDSSVQASVLQKCQDERVRYFSIQEGWTLGEKRNFLLEQARGQIVVHMDDDDYYAPSYLTKVVSLMQDADFFTLSTFFCYDLSHHGLYYWDQRFWEKMHFSLGQAGEKGRSFPIDETWKGNDKEAMRLAFERGYGFSYAYRQEVAKALKFLPRDFAEDAPFCQAAVEKGFRLKLLADEEGLILHTSHRSSSSLAFPQYALPPFLLAHFFPGYKVQPQIHSAQ